MAYSDKPLTANVERGHVTHFVLVPGVSVDASGTSGIWLSKPLVHWIAPWESVHLKGTLDGVF